MKERRPKPFGVGPWRVEPVRKPKRGGPGVWYWRAVEYVEGAPVYRWTGTGTKTEAAQAVAALVAVGDQRTARERRKAADGAIGTVRDLLELHIGELEARAELGGLAARSLSGRRGAARRLLKELGERQAADLDQALVDHYARARLARGAAPSTVHLDVRELREALAWAAEARLMPEIRVRLPALDLKERRRNAYTPSREEIEKILAAMRPGHWSRLALWLLVETGARLGELALVTWGDLELEHDAASSSWTATLRLHGRGRMGREARKGKTGERWIPLGAELAAELARRRPDPCDPDAGIYGVGAATVSAQLGPRWLADACEAAGLPRWAPGGGRRYVSETLLGDPSVDLVGYQALTGHDPQTALRNYAKARGKHLRKLAAPLSLRRPSLE